MAKADGDPRPIGAIRAELFSLLLRRPGGHGQPGVAAQLTITATLDSLAGAWHARGGGERAGDHRRPRPGAAGPDRRPRADRARGRPADVRDHRRRRAAAGHHHGRRAAAGRQDRLRRAPRRDCGCPVLGVPPDTGAYEPTGRQETFVQTRDRTCRMPNCAQRVGWADLDHVIPHSCGGQTSCTNLCCLCRTDHRLKTFASRLDLRDGGRRHPARHHPVRDHPHHPATRPPPTPTRTAAGRTGPRPTTLLERPRSAHPDEGRACSRLDWWGPESQS